MADEVAALDAAADALGAGTPLYRAQLDDDQRAALKPWFLLTNKPVMAVVNIGEDQLDDVDTVTKPVAAELDGLAEVLGVSVQLEAEAAQLDADERADLLEGFGLGEGALPRFVRAAYHLLGLRTFLTTGEKESRAWTFRAGAKAPVVRRGHPHRLRAGVHPSRGHRMGRAAGDRVLERRPGHRGASGSRARTTRWRMVTSWRSGSTCEPVDRVTGHGLAAA